MLQRVSRCDSVTPRCNGFATFCLTPETRRCRASRPTAPSRSAARCRCTASSAATCEPPDDPVRAAREPRACRIVAAWSPRVHRVQVRLDPAAVRAKARRAERTPRIAPLSGTRYAPPRALQPLAGNLAVFGYTAQYPPRRAATTRRGRGWRADGARSGAAGWVLCAPCGYSRSTVPLVAVLLGCHAGRGHGMTPGPHSARLHGNQVARCILSFRPADSALQLHRGGSPALLAFGPLAQALAELRSWC
jgi:hypothetical protein